MGLLEDVLPIFTNRVRYINGFRAPIWIPLLRCSLRAYLITSSDHHLTTFLRALIRTWTVGDQEGAHASSSSSRCASGTQRNLPATTAQQRPHTYVYTRMSAISPDLCQYLLNTRTIGSVFALAGPSGVGYIWLHACPRAQCAPARFTLHASRRRRRSRLRASNIRYLGFLCRVV